MKSVNPATGDRIAQYDDHDAAKVDQIVSAATRAQRRWQATDFAERTKALEGAASALQGEKQELAALMAEEMGKPIREGRSEVEKCAWVCRYYAREAEGFLSEQPVSEIEDADARVVFRPLGLVLAVMPRNFPFWQVFRFAAPNLMAGNGGLLKHASNVSGCALAIERILGESFPEDLFRTLLIPSRDVADVIEDERVRAVTLTGSTPAGKAVARRAGAALKKTVLELGGSDPYLILEDADLEQSVAKCVTSRLINSGQSCIAAKRFIVVRPVWEEFVEGFLASMRSKTWGDPTDESVDIGPMARFDLRDELHQQVETSVEGGAELLLGGEIPEGPGAFYPPTVLARPEPGTPAFDDELFGPVATLIEVEDEEHAIELANGTDFGLGAAVFTRDRARGLRIAADRLDAGCCFVNDFVRSDPRLPFGGVKSSGYGRELGRNGIHEFVNTKSVWVG